MTAERYGLGEIEGTYKPTIREQLCNIFKRKKVKFPTNDIADMHTAAIEYNKQAYDEHFDLDDEGRRIKIVTQKSDNDIRREFRERVKANKKMKRKDSNKLSKSQVNELDDLVDKQHPYFTSGIEEGR